MHFNKGMLHGSTMQCAKHQYYFFKQKKITWTKSVPCAELIPSVIVRSMLSFRVSESSWMYLSKYRMYCYFQQIIIILINSSSFHIHTWPWMLWGPANWSCLPLAVPCPADPVFHVGDESSHVPWADLLSCPHPAPAGVPPSGNCHHLPRPSAS